MNDELENKELSDEFLEQTANADRTSVTLPVSWNPVELLQIFRRANKLSIDKLRELLDFVGVKFVEPTHRADYISALDEADDKEKIYRFLDGNNV